MLFFILFSLESHKSNGIIWPTRMRLEHCWTFWSTVNRCLERLHFRRGFLVEKFWKLENPNFLKIMFLKNFIRISALIVGLFGVIIKTHPLMRKFSIKYPKSQLNIYPLKHMYPHKILFIRNQQPILKVSKTFEYYRI